MLASFADIVCRSFSGGISYRRLKGAGCWVLGREDVRCEMLAGRGERRALSVERFRSVRAKEDEMSDVSSERNVTPWLSVILRGSL